MTLVARVWGQQGSAHGVPRLWNPGFHSDYLEMPVPDNSEGRIMGGRMCVEKGHISFSKNVLVTFFCF